MASEVREPQTFSFSKESKLKFMETWEPLPTFNISMWNTVLSILQGESLSLPFSLGEYWDLHASTSFFFFLLMKKSICHDYSASDFQRKNLSMFISASLFPPLLSGARIKPLVKVEIIFIKQSHETMLRNMI